MAVSFVDQANTGADTLAASHQVTRPAGVAAGDVVVLTLVRWESANSFPATTGPSGSVARGSLVAGAGGNWQDSHVFLKYVGAETTYTVSWTGARFSCLVAEFFTGVDAGLDLAAVPFQITSVLNATAVPTATVTTVAGAGLSWHVNTQGYGSTTTHEPPSGFTETAETDAWAVGHRIASGAGSQSASGATVAPSQPQLIASLVALAPAAGGPSPITGTGTAAPAAAQATASGGVTTVASGAAGAAAAGVAGTGSLDTVHVSGSGAAAASSALLSGSGQVTAAATGSPASSPAQAAGDAAVPVSGSGSAAAAAAVVSGRESAAGPFVVGVSGLHFVDAAGEPILVRGDTVWAFPVNAGRWNGGDWAADFDAYFAARGSQGYNAVYHAALGSTQNNGPFNTGATFDGHLPFVGGEPGDLNETYWARVDYMLDRAEGLGITVFLNWAYSDDLANAALSGKTSTQCEAYGAALGSRYGNRPNLVWGIGGDYFGSDDTRVTAVLNGIRSTGDTHLIAIQYYPETTSRQDLQSGSAQPWGVTNAQYNFVYSYNVLYYGVEEGYAETPLIPVLWGDGTYDDDSSADRLIMRNHTWWALTSGSRGNIYGGEGIWGWGAGALAQVQSTTSGFADEDLPVIRDTFAGLQGWHELLPDLDSSLVTGGRGTRATSLASGGGGGQYDGSPQDTWVSVGVTPDGSLAVIYCPTGTTLTVDDTELAATYTATWIDPVTGAATAETVGPTYTTPGTNSVGGNDWVLALAASDPSSSGSGQAASAPAVMSGAAAVTATTAGQAAPAAAIVSGVGSAAVTASGQASPAAQVVAGSGGLTAVATASGQAAAAAATVTGTGEVAVAASGQVTATGALSGAGSVPSTGAGQATAAPAVAAGLSGSSFGAPVPNPTTVLVAAHSATVDTVARSGTVEVVPASATVLVTS